MIFLEVNFVLCLLVHNIQYYLTWRSWKRLHKAGPGKIAFFDQLRRDFWIFKVKECFENVPSSFWWNLETFGQPGEKISVILHQRVCGIFPPGGRAGAEFRAGGARAFIGGTKNSRERVTHTTQWTETRHGRCAVLRWGV